MANEAFLLSAAVMGILLVGAALATSWTGRRRSYRPSFQLTTDGDRVDGLASRVTLSNAAFAGSLALLAVFVGSALLGNPTLGLLAVALATIAAYFAWGVYNIARVRGLPVAHSVGLSAWLFAVLLVAAIAVQLLFG